MNDDVTPQTLGARLKALRKMKRGLTQDDVAAAVGVSRSHIAGCESGGDLPGRDTLIALAGYFGVKLSYLLRGDDVTAQLPETPQVVDDPDELAFLALWRDLDEGERRLMLKILGRPPID